MKISPKMTRFWTDSEIVWHWLRRPSTSWKIFVANRVQAIHDVSEPDWWSHVPSKENPADLMSRGASVDLLKRSSLYWSGPDWLQQDEEHWPRFGDNLEVPPEVDEEASKKIVILSVSVEEDTWLFARYEEFSKIIHVLCRILQFLGKLSRAGAGRALTAEQYAKGELMLLKLVQMHSFPDEYTQLKTSQGQLNGQLTALNPILDANTELIVVGGRLSQSSFEENFKHQIILPSNHLVVQKLIKHVHVLNCHAGPETTLCCLRQRFWILRGRRAVSKVLRNCLICRHHKTCALDQQMAPLPPERIEIAPAFTNVGLDFTGPVLIREDSLLKKAYICIFTCAQSRMAHFEIVRNMETDEFLQALRRMTNRRGMCRIIISDNQTTFKKAARMLEKAESSPFSLEHHIRWKFITERSPFRGGFYERLNQSLKNPLRKILGKAIVTYVEL